MSDTEPARRPIPPSVERRILRDIDDGHLAVWRRIDGTDRADRPVIGAGKEWWLVLEADGLAYPPQCGAWRLTDAGRARLAELNSEAGRR